MELIKHCYHCYSTRIDEDLICDRCDEYYCEDCSYTFSLHYQFTGSRCYYCADQSRRNGLTKQQRRDSKLELWLKSIEIMKKESLN